MAIVGVLLVLCIVGTIVDLKMKKKNDFKWLLPWKRPSAKKEEEIQELSYTLKEEGAAPATKCMFFFLSSFFPLLLVLFLPESF